MNDINFKDIRVLPSSLDIKNNANKSTSEIATQLQSGITMKAVVTGINRVGGVVLDTPYGKFTAINRLNLAQGDAISVKLLNVDNITSGYIVSVNGNRTKLDEPVRLKFVSQSQTKASKNNNIVGEPSVNIKNTGNVPRNITGEVSYLNFSKINKLSRLFQVINHAAISNQQKVPIVLNVISDNRARLSAFAFEGLISGNEKNGHQLIKTDFGIITCKNTNMPIGQKLMLELVSIDGRAVGVDLSLSILDLISKVNANWLVLKNLTSAFLGPINTKQLAEDIRKARSVFTEPNKHASKDESYLATGSKNFTDKINQGKETATKLSTNALNPSALEYKSLNSVIDSFGSKGEISKLIAEYQTIKELLEFQDTKANLVTQQWQSVLIPFYNGQQIKEYGVKIDRSNKLYLRFILNVEFGSNQIQLDGVIGFESSRSQKLKSFDLIVRSKKVLAPALQKKFASIYNVNKTMSGIIGSFTIEISDNFEG
ncbi:MAG: hypothetical protein Tsb006_4230 [Rickettsiaceae bacterium]